MYFKEKNCKDPFSSSFVAKIGRKASILTKTSFKWSDYINSFW